MPQLAWCTDRATIDGHPFLLKGNGLQAPGHLLRDGRKAYLRPRTFLPTQAQFWGPAVESWTTAAMRLRGPGQIVYLCCQMNFKLNLISSFMVAMSRTMIEGTVKGRLDLADPYRTMDKPTGGGKIPPARPPRWCRARSTIRRGAGIWGVSVKISSPQGPSCT